MKVATSWQLNKKKSSGVLLQYMYVLFNDVQSQASMVKEINWNIFLYNDNFTSIIFLFLKNYNFTKF